MVMLKRIFAILLLSVSIASAEQMSVPFLKTDFCLEAIRAARVPHVISFYSNWTSWNEPIPDGEFSAFVLGFKQALNPFQWKQIFTELLRRKEQLEFIKSGKYYDEFTQGREPYEGFGSC